MWIDELNNVVIENKTKKTFHEKVLWSHDGLNVQIQFVHCYSWGSVELKSEQYEAIEETSSDTHTYDTQYNTESVYNIVEFENLLFVDDKIFVGTEFCVTRDQSGKYPIPTDDTLSAMLDLTWFEEKYGFCKKDISNIDNTLLQKEWELLGKIYYINGDITLMGKNNYDYLWLNNNGLDEQKNVAGTHPYGDRINFLNNQK